MTVDTLKQVEELIIAINKIHFNFSNDYFENGKIEKINLSRTISHIPTEHIYKYRLNLHESINDYLMTTNISIKYFYRVKTSESIADKIKRYSNRENQYPVNNWLNDIFGVRIILNSEEIAQITEVLDKWHEDYGLKNWYFRDAQGYKGLHIYFKNKSNFFYPWELQIWNKEDVQSNIENHQKFKRNFV